MQRSGVAVVLGMRRGNGRGGGESVFGVRFGGFARLPSVVRGTGVGLYSDPMPGTLCLRGDEVLWIAEGTKDAVSLSGHPEPSPVTDAPVPRELTFGVMPAPTTVRVRLHGGGLADVTVRRGNADHVRRALNWRTGASGAPRRAPRLPARAPIGPKALFLALMVGILGLGLVEPQSFVERAVVGIVQMIGLVLLKRGRRLAKNRAELVLANRVSRNEDKIAGRPAGLIPAARDAGPGWIRAGDVAVRAVGGIGLSAAVAPAADAGQAVAPVATLKADPLTVPLTFEPMRSALAARCADEAWARRDRVDPHSWSQALRHILGWYLLGCLLGGALVAGVGMWVVDLVADPPGWVGSAGRWLLAGYAVLVLVAAMGAVRFMIRARRVADHVPTVSARYLLARDFADDDHLILFPLVGDVGPLGVIELELPAAGAIPLAGMVELAGPVDPATRRPVEWTLLVPILDARPLWPAGEFAVPEAEELRDLVTGKGPFGDE